jgi:hypothetical protein
MSIKLTNQSTKDSEAARDKAIKRDFVFGLLAGGLDLDGGANEERIVGNVSGYTSSGDSTLNTTSHNQASDYLDLMRINISLHDSYTLATLIDADGGPSAVEDVIDDFLGGSHSEAMDVLVEVNGNGITLNGSDDADLTADLKAFADAQDAGTEALETTASINTTASLGVSMSAGDGWTASTSGTLNLAGGSVAGGTVSLSNGTMTLSVGKTQHAATSAVTSMYGMDVALDTNAADTQLQATLALGGATLHFIFQDLIGS